MKIKIDFKKGFTILEFLVVIAIMGILMSVALFGINLSRERGRDNSRISDMQLVILAMEQYRDVCREYPYSIYDDTSANAIGCPTSSGITWDDFMPDPPYDPNGDPYQYTGLESFTSQPRCIGYHLAVRLEQDSNKYLQRDADENTSTVSQRCGSFPDDINADTSSNGFDYPTEFIYDIYKSN